MFQPMDIANGGSQQVVIRSNQSQQQQQTPQMFTPQYGYQQQHSYFATYPNAPNSGASSAPNKGDMNFVAQQPSPYVQQQHPVLSYRYTQEMPNSNQYINPVRYQPNQDNQRLLTSVGYVTGNSGQEGFQMPSPPQQQQQQQPPHQLPNQQRGGRGRGGLGGCGLNGSQNGNGNFIPYYRQVHNNYYYNQQHHYSNNNAVPEKTPTLHVLNPTTKKVMCVKLNRIYSTMADLHLHPNQSNQNENSKETNSSANNQEDSTSNTPLMLCVDFLSLRGCAHGSGCEKVHVAGLEYMWSPIEPSIVSKDGKEIYKPGFRVHCYDSVLTTYYDIPSEIIEVTRGSETYVEMFNEHRDNFKTKIKLCPSVLNDETCKKGRECPNIHCLSKEFAEVQERNTRSTHINHPPHMKDVPRLPADMIVRVFDQNSDKNYHDYPGTNVLITEGAKNYIKYYERKLHNIPFCKRMQHCAHFRLKEMCRLGASCRFLHVLPTPEEVQEMRNHEALVLTLKDQTDQGQVRYL
ncbi:unnamed protein product [Phytomonas sp. EM1]|nr:unnamed protein product [Phytomonas sp. EM1]|eukprot:CCW59961.1 unnamed protein product [Phytomonas sp. isolate EM1]